VLDGKQLSARNCCNDPDHDKAGSERDCEPIKVQSIPVLSRFRSWPKWSVSVQVIPVLSCICSRRARPGEHLYGSPATSQPLELVHVP